MPAGGRGLKRLRVEQEEEPLTWRGEPKFTDWTLTWGDDASGRIAVHRVILAHSCHFFRGATNESFQGTSTDLSKLLPESCRSSLEVFLDWVYGGSAGMGVVADACLLPLLHMADMLQCAALKNHVVDQLERRASERDFTTGDWPLLDATVAWRDIDLFRDLLPLFPVEALKSRAHHIAVEGGPDHVAMAMGELARKATVRQPDLATCVVTGVGAYSFGQSFVSAPVLETEAEFRLLVCPAGKDSDAGREAQRLRGRLFSVFARAVALKDAPEGDKLGPFTLEAGVVHWETGEVTFKREATFTFKQNGAFFGWHDFATLEDLVSSGLVRPSDDAVKLSFAVRRGPFTVHLDFAQLGL